MSREQMQSIPIEDILARPKLLADIYLCISSEKYLLVAKSGADSSPLNKYRERNVEHLFVRASDFIAIVQSTIAEANLIANAEGVPDEARLAGVRGAMKIVHQEIQDLGFDETVLNHAKLVNSATLTILSRNPRLLDMIARMELINNDAAKHAMMVSIISAMLGVAHGWIKPGTIEKLSLGGFLHDVGLTKIPKDIAMKPVGQMTPDELAIYRSHPEVGAHLLMQAKSIPDDVLQIVQEHHELSDGTGYPRGVRDLLISPLAKVVCLANAFATMVEEAPGATSAEKTKAAIDELVISRKHLYNRDAIKALLRLFPQERGRAAG